MKSMQNIRLHDDQVLGGFWSSPFTFQFDYVIILRRILLVFEKSNPCIGKSICGIIPSVNVFRLLGLLQIINESGMIGLAIFQSKSQGLLIQMH